MVKINNMELTFKPIFPEFKYMAIHRYKNATKVVFCNDRQVGVVVESKIILDVLMNPMLIYNKEICEAINKFNNLTKKQRDEILQING